ncbi:response regulator transcription factor, partial [Escherichia coli]|uniref:response regulator transcription factor n=1 Tax=Escherichia coli TaxID=562 RepID=UPI001FA9911E
DRNRSHWSTSKTPSYTKSVSWQHHLLAAGESNKEIGRALNISTGMVKAHLESLYRRLEVKNRTQTAMMLNISS